MRKPEDFVTEYRAKGYPDERIRIIASMRPEPMRSEILKILDAATAPAEAVQAAQSIEPAVAQPTPQAAEEQTQVGPAPAETGAAQVEPSETPQAAGTPETPAQPARRARSPRPRRTAKPPKAEVIAEAVPEPSLGIAADSSSEPGSDAATDPEPVTEVMAETVSETVPHAVVEAAPKTSVIAAAETTPDVVPADEAATLRSQIEARTQEAAELRGRIEDLSGEIAKSSQALKAQDDRIALLQKERDDLATERDALRTERDRVVEARQAVQAGQELSEQRLVQIEENRKALEAEATGLREKVGSLTQQLASVSAERDAVVGKQQDLQRSVEEGHTAAESATAELRNLAGEHDTLAAKYRELRDERDHIVRRLETMQAEHGALASERSALEQKAADLAREREQLNARVSELEARIEQRQAADAGTQQKLVSKLASVAEEREQFRAQCEVLSEQLLNMRKEYDALVDDRDRMAAQAHSLEAREQELTRQLEAAASQATAASAESQSLRQKEEALSGELAEIRRRLEEVNADRNELARARAEGAERIAELESELAAQTRRVQEVSQEVETLRRTKMDLEAQGEKVRTETTTLRQQIEANARAAEELEHQLASRDEEMLALRVRFQQEAERLRSRAEEQKRHINHRLVKFRRLAASFGVAFAASLMVIFSIAKNDYPGNRALTVNAASGQEASQDRRLPEMGADKVVTPGASREEPAPGAPSGTAQTPSVEDKPAAASPVDGLPPISLFRKPEGAPASAAEATVVEKAEPSSRPPDRAAQARDKAAATDAKTAQSKKSDKAPVVVLHAVQKGETLRSICAKHGINTQKGVEAVSRMNSIADPDKIRVGQVLRIAKNETI